MQNLTAQQVQALTERVFVRFNFAGDFKVLQDFNGDTFDALEDAKKFARKHLSDRHVQLSSMKQALMGNGEWDNL